MPRAPSLETILTYQQKQSRSDNWSVMWSTENIPAMDTATGSGRTTLRQRGRRRLRWGSLALGCFLAMHCRIAASAVTDGFFLFMVFLIVAVALLGNPMRHFEVYLGQWSISGPGRAFRMVPMLDGIGVAICINAIVRAIYCVCIAAIAGVYVTHSASSAPLPFTFCRDFNMQPYEPSMVPVKVIALQDKFTMLEDEYGNRTDDFDTPTAIRPPRYTFKRSVNTTNFSRSVPLDGDIVYIQVCKEKFYGSYPPLYTSPAYNFFYVEVMRLQDIDFKHFNMIFLVWNICAWVILWWLMIGERLSYGKLIWNNVYSWIKYLPWAWAVILLTISLIHLGEINKVLVKVFRVGTKEFLWGIADALEAALYVHAAGLGTEVIHGKGLNYFASGHIDPLLNSESVWHSGLVLLLCCLISSGAAVCAVVDYVHPENDVGPRDMHGSKLWLIPMYSQCMIIGNYSHFATLIIFSGIVLAHIIPAYIILKTALHIIFEYRVKLVFVEQIVVAGLVLICLAASLVVCIWGGLALLEGIDALMTGIAMTFICFMELLALVWVYRSPDFLSDIDVATEENACASRIGLQWQIIPGVCLFVIIVKVISLASAEVPSPTMWLGTVPLIMVLLAIPVRAIVNAYAFLRPSPRRGV